MEIDYEIDADVLHVHLGGDWTGLHDSRRVIEDYTARARKEGLRRALLHDRSTGRKQTAVEAYEEGEMFSAMAVGLKVAVVPCYPDKRTGEGISFAVLVASNRSGHAALFENVADATEWLA